MSFFMSLEMLSQLVLLGLRGVYLFTNIQKLGEAELGKHICEFREFVSNKAQNGGSEPNI